MHIITQTRLRIFAKAHPDADGPLRAWETIMRAKKYKDPHEVKADFGSVDFPGDGKAVFNIGGNKYRLVTKMMYTWGKILILEIWTHREYDRFLKKGKF
ncbi:MAG: type II toxin-antitoxin system HigB family toxin [Nitrospira sp.]|nr:type II toxin-antitoxin system HigB family toxin [Nitrospira sp.]